MRIIAVASAQERAALIQPPALPLFDPNQILDQGADLHLCALASGGEIRAYCSLWWKQAPALADHRVGAIGHYACLDEETADALLAEATLHLRENGCSLAIAPMDGNTWRRYRFVTGASSIEPPFFLEPTNPPEWPSHFEQAGFTSLARYYSAVNCDLARPDERIAPISVRMESAGVRIRSALGTDLREELKRIYQLSRIAFRRNFLYTELAEHAFIAQYIPLLSRVQPELILLAERGPDLAGYLFAIPDFAQAARGSAIDTFIIKTVAILPEPELRGLGGLLVSHAHQVGHKLGFRRAIHALMHEDNASRHISSHYAETMRQYTLYCLGLSS